MTSAAGIGSTASISAGKQAGDRLVGRAGDGAERPAEAVLASRPVPAAAG